MTDSIGHYRIKIGITTEEARAETVIHTQHILNYQYLSVYISTGTDTDHRNGQFACDT